MTIDLSHLMYLIYIYKKDELLSPICFIFLLIKGAKMYDDMETLGKSFYFKNGVEHNLKSISRALI